jgi:glycosyltransferase involved in cell wall biosynthesis
MTSDPIPAACPDTTPNEYLSCEYIHSGLCFDFNRVLCCAIYHHGTGQVPLIGDYAGDPLSFEHILAVRKEIVELNQRDGYPNCRGCLFLKRRAWLEGKYPVRWLGLTNWLACNLRCDYCLLQWDGVGAQVRARKIPAQRYDLRPVVRQLINEGWLAPDAVVDWGGGGEPTRMPGFDQLLVQLDAHGTTQWLHTNGTRLPKPILDRTVNTSRIRVLCSIDAGTPQAYRRMKGRDLYDLVWRNLEIYAGAGVEVTVKYIMRDENCSGHELRRFVCDAQRHGRPSLVGDVDYRYPDPNEKVTKGLAYMKLLASRARLNFALGGPGCVASPEAELDARIDRLWRRSVPGDPRHSLWVVKQWFKLLLTAVRNLESLKQLAQLPQLQALPLIFGLSRRVNKDAVHTRPGPPWLLVGLVLSSCSYLVFWLRMHRMKHPQHLSAFRMAFQLLPAFIVRLTLPRLGRLYQYEPVPFRLPARYRIPKRLFTGAPTISIVTPCKNPGVFLAKTIESISSQHYPALEYVIQEGGSTDGTRELLNRIRGEVHSVESCSDGGQANALNNGFAKTSGEIMAWLNADDLLLPGTLHYVARYFQRHRDVEVVYGHRVLIDEHDREIGRWVLPPHDADVLRCVDLVPQETLFWRRELWEHTGGYIDESFDFAVDWELLLRFLVGDAKIVRVPRFLGAFRVHASQKTSSHFETVGRAEIERLRLRYLGRRMSDEEIPACVVTYLIRSLVYDYSYRLGLLRY